MLICQLLPDESSKQLKRSRKIITRFWNVLTLSLYFLKISKTKIHICLAREPQLMVFKITLLILILAEPL